MKYMLYGSHTTGHLPGTLELVLLSHPTAEAVTAGPACKPCVAALLRL
jgi:hypothetical protein